MNVLAIFNKCW